METSYLEEIKNIKNIYKNFKVYGQKDIRNIHFFLKNLLKKSRTNNFKSHIGFCRYNFKYLNININFEINKKYCSFIIFTSFTRKKI